VLPYGKTQTGFDRRQLNRGVWCFVSEQTVNRPSVPVDQNTRDLQSSEEPALESKSDKSRLNSHVLSEESIRDENAHWDYAFKVASKVTIRFAIGPKESPT
jgi:hypothetical protein